MGRLIISKQLEKASGQYYTVQSDVNGDLQFVTVASIVTGNETTTSIVDNVDGTFDYVDENGGTTTVVTPYIAQLNLVENAVADSMLIVPFLVTEVLDGRDITRFRAYFAHGSGTHTLALKKNGTVIASVTSLTSPGGGVVAVTGHSLATGDILVLAFTTTVTGHAGAFGAVTII